MNALADDTSFKVDINVPYVVDLVKTKEARTSTFDRVSFLAESAKNFLGPAVSVELPTDIKGLAKNALSGGASVIVNGLDLGIKVVASEKGALTVQLRNDLLPALPFVGLENTPAYVNKAGEVVANSAPAVVDAAIATVKEINKQMNKGPFWERPILGGSVRLDVSVGDIDIHKVITPVEIVGAGSAGLGVIYAASFSYYKYSLAEEEKKAAEMKEAAAARRDEIAAKKRRNQNTRPKFSKGTGRRDQEDVHKEQEVLLH
jgi:hypothetical protein